MKSSLKKSFLLLGVTAVFVLTAWAGNEDEPGWFDTNVARELWCNMSGTFVELGSRPGAVFGYCRCEQGFIGHHCEWTI